MSLQGILQQPVVRLNYTVHSSSGYHTSFPPTKIYQHCPSDDTSRWTAPTPEERKRERKSSTTTATTSKRGGTRGGRESEWILLELDQPGLVSFVGFGKTTKPHPCNLSEFTIFGGLDSTDPESMELLVDGTLKNDTTTERIKLPETIEAAERESKSGSSGVFFPIKYLRIECHEAASPNYSISIWHLFLEGHHLPSPLLSLAIDSYQHHISLTTSHLILSHLRRQGPEFLSTFETYLGSLPREIRDDFEHGELRNLHQSLVIEGDFERGETVLKRCFELGLFNEWAATSSISSSTITSTSSNLESKSILLPRQGITTARWERLDSLFPSNENNNSQPGPRGGHQMVRVGRKLLLFGGWDGKKDLGDLWEWELPRGSGRGDLDREGGEEGGPREGEEEFIGWRCLSSGEGGEEEKDGKKTRPGKRSCHQLSVDESTGWVYLLGARRDEEDEDDRLSEEEDEVEGGEDMEIEQEGGGVEQHSNNSHDEKKKKKRQRGEDQDRWKSDFWRYKAVGPGKGEWELLSEDTREQGGPALLFDHSMVVDSSNQRLFVFGGKWQPYQGGGGGNETAPRISSSSSSGNNHNATNTSAPSSQYSGMYCYDIRSKKWTHLFGDPSTNRTPSEFLTDRLLPRAGHSMIIDSTRRDPTIYIYGGQRDTQYENDLWAVRLASLPRNRDDEEEMIADDGDEEDDEDERGFGDEERTWRQGGVIDLPQRAIASSLIDPSVLPASPERSPHRNSHASSATSSVPTIVQIRRMFPPSSSSSTSSSTSPSSTSSGIVPPPAFTPRLSLTSNRSITLLTGLTRVGKGSSMTEVPLEGVWRKSRGVKSEWTRVEEWGGNNDQERKPRGRFASQVVYDPLRNEHYLFGGHPHDSSKPETRLSDFWKLKIVDPTPEEALRMCKFLIRKQRFNEMCTTVPTLFALQYLQNNLSSVVDHSSPSESTAFRSCMTSLLSAPPQHNVEVSLDGSGELPPKFTASDEEKEGGGDEKSRIEKESYRARHRLFEELMHFFPRGQRQPVEELDQVGRLLRTLRK